MNISSPHRQMKGWNDGQGYAIARQLFSSESSTLMNASIDHFSALMDKYNISSSVYVFTLAFIRFNRLFNMR